MSDLGESPTLRVTQAQTLDWVRDQWPDRTAPIWRAGKLCEEAGEAMGAVIKMDEGRKTIVDAQMECAQVVICAMALAESIGFDLEAAVAAEFERVGVKPAARELVVPSPQPADELDVKIVRDLAALDPLIPAGAGSVLDEVYCALCLAEGPASRPGDDFEHEASCPWLRAVIMQIEAAAVSPLPETEQTPDASS